VDSSAFKANYDSDDDFHDNAAELMRTVAARKSNITYFVTTDYVLDEAVTLTRFASSHSKAVELIDAARNSRFLQIVYSDEQLFSEGVELFKSHKDKEWSLTDCISFATMNKLDVKTAFTFNAHFRQAGFATMP
jgi:uncharacterized protein